MLTNKRVFVSGGAGVIGQELIPKLIAQGAEVLVGDLKPKPNHFPNKVNYIQGDLNYLSAEALAEFSPELFIHLAATFERSTETYSFWEENFWHNVRLSHHLATITKDLASVKKVINASSYLIYDPALYSFHDPQAKACSLKETDPIYPRNLTGMAKLAHEIELRFLEQFKKGEKSYVNARIYRGYGKGSRCVISRWIRALLAGETIKVYRKEGLFDYIYAGDTADGLIQLAIHEQAQGIINLGTGEAQRVEKVLEILKKHFPTMQFTEHDSDIPYEASEANIELLTTITGWKPKTRLEDAIPLIIEYERQYFSLEKKASRHVMLSSVSKKVSMVNALKHAGRKLGQNTLVIGADANKDCIGKYFTDSFWEMPRLDELKINHLIDYCHQNNINAIVPSRDQELPYFAKGRHELEKAGISVMISSEETINMCLDKLAFFKVMSELGFPAITTSQNLLPEQGHRWVVKERYGAGSAGLAINVSAEEAKSFARKLEYPIFQPYIAGKEYSIDAYVSKSGNVKGVICRTRDLVINGESQITTTNRHEKMETMVKEILSKFGFYGHVIFQIIEDEANNLHIIECNPRFGGASTLSVAAGLDSFYWFLLESQGVDIDPYIFTRSKEEKKQIRGVSDMVISA